MNSRSSGENPENMNVTWKKKKKAMVKTMGYLAAYFLT